LNKTLPILESDREAEAFVETADLSQYDLSPLTPTSFEFGAKSARVNMRLPAPLLERVKAKAASEGIPYQRFIRSALEAAIAPKAR
jgi:predicted DNA binding CopG/RHH family protein